MKKVLSIVLCTVMLLSLFVLPTSAAAWNGTDVSTELKGEGTAEKPYLVETPADLAFLAKSVNEGNNYAGKYITQTADIDLGGKEWTAIGNGTTQFAGIYDGKGFKVEGLSITKSANYMGLFGYVRAKEGDAGVANLTVDGSIVTADSAGFADNMGVAAVIGSINVDGTNRVKVINVTNNVNITIADSPKQIRLAAVVGIAYCTDFENVVNNGDVIVNSTVQTRVAGFVGQTNRSTFVNCVNNGDVTVTQNAGNANVGGFVGMITYYDYCSQQILFENCVNNGNVTSEITAGTDLKMMVGGFVGGHYSGAGGRMNIKLAKCVNTGAISGKKPEGTQYPYVGGIYANPYYADTVVEACVNTGVITSEGGAGSRAGGIVGVMNNPSVTSMYCKDCISTSNISAYIKNAQDGCVANAEAAVAAAAVKAVEDAIAPSYTRIAGFDTGYKAPVVPEPPVDPQPPVDPEPPVESGDITVVLALVAILALGGAVVTKKISVR